MNISYKIKNIEFKEGFLSININGADYRFLLKDISEKLFNASYEELTDFKISPSGYGINWIKLDEDISIPGLLNSNNKKKSKHTTYKLRKPKVLLVKDKQKK